jgi:hypothetical protein
MAKEIKIFNCENTAAPLSCLTLNELIEGGATLTQLPPNTGLYQTTPQSAGVEFKRARNAKEIKKGGAYVILGADRPSSLVSGYGGKGAQNASTIDLVVGRMSSVNEGLGAAPLAKVDNSFVADAARIYISQLTDVDANFGLAGGEEGSMSQKGGSAIGIKADGIRIIGREGIKIVTGKAQGPKAGSAGELNSRGGKIKTPAPPIELIAGNSVAPVTVPGGKFLPGGTIEKLQPIPLGSNTRDALQELSDIVGELWSAVFNFALIQSGQNVAFGTSPFAWQPAAVAAATPIHLSYVINSLYQTRVNNTLWQLNYLNPLGYKYICSRSVKTT